jgi:hypothetical protein
LPLCLPVSYLLALSKIAALLSDSSPAEARAIRRSRRLLRDRTAETVPGSPDCARLFRHLCAENPTWGTLAYACAPQRDEAKGARLMTFKVYSGPTRTDAVAPIHKDRMLFKEFQNFDDALSWASHIKDTGRTAVLIEDAGGRTLNKSEIAAALAERRARDVHRPAARV